MDGRCDEEKECGVPVDPKCALAPVDLVRTSLFTKSMNTLHEMPETERSSIFVSMLLILTGTCIFLGIGLAVFGDVRRWIAFTILGFGVSATYVFKGTALRLAEPRVVEEERPKGNSNW